MKSRLVLAVGIALIALVVFVAGYQRGQRQLPEQSMVEGNLAMSMALYQSVTDEDWNRLKSNLEISILGQVRSYDDKYGPVTGTNQFARLFQEASVVADKAESRLVPLTSVITYIPGGSNATIRLSDER